MSVVAGIMFLQSTGRPTTQPIRKNPNMRLRKGQYETSVPTVADRIAQTVVALQLQPRTESIFHDDSFGYRPGRSAHDALERCRRRCWQKDWVLDCDIQKFFDSLDHRLVVRAVKANTDQRWVLLYVKRWLTAPLRLSDGTLQDRDRGTPQGSAVSPVLANVVLHYAFDMFLEREFPSCDIRTVRRLMSNST